jgi:hypothetical protein
MDLSQKTAYLKGLADGSGLAKDEKYGDFVNSFLDCLQSMAEEIETVEEYVHEVKDYAESIDEDLGDLEDVVFSGYDMDDFDDFDEEEEDEEEDHDDDADFIETVCPVCGETIGYYTGDYDEPVEIVCPNCDTVVATLGTDVYEEDADDEVIDEDDIEEE